MSWSCQLPRVMLRCSKSTWGGTSKPRELGWLLSGLSPLERRDALRTTLSRPVVEARQYARTRWAVHLNTVTYELLSGGQSITEGLGSFLAVFKRLRR